MTLLPDTRGRVRAPAVAAACGAAGLVADLAFDPVHTHVPLCPFHAVTGWWCPLCGGLRAVYSLARLHWRVALHDNVLVVALLPVAVVLWVEWALRARAGRPGRAISRPAVAVLVAIMFAFTVVRNLPFAEAIRPR